MYGRRICQKSISNGQRKAYFFPKMSDNEFSVEKDPCDFADDTRVVMKCQKLKAVSEETALQVFVLQPEK